MDSSAATCIKELARQEPRQRATTRRWGIVGALVVTTLLFAQGLAVGVTTIQSGPRQVSSATNIVPNSSVPATLVSAVLAVVPANVPTSPIAGTHAAGTSGLAGATATLPACNITDCTQHYRFALPTNIVVGDYSERLTLVIDQPFTGAGASTGLAIDFAVRTTAGWFTAQGYLATGTSTLTGGSIIHVQLYLDLATATRPTVLVVALALNPCAAPGECP
ncbi:MAG: hypothetical protein WCA77_08000 [Thermoplasmata archaeon]